MQPIARVLNTFNSLPVIPKATTASLALCAMIAPALAAKQEAEGESGFTVIHLPTTAFVVVVVIASCWLRRAAIRQIEGEIAELQNQLPPPGALRPPGALQGIETRGNVVMVTTISSEYNDFVFRDFNNIGLENTAGEVAEAIFNNFNRFPIIHNPEWGMYETTQRLEPESNNTIREILEDWGFGQELTHHIYISLKTPEQLAELGNMRIKSAQTKTVNRSE